MIFGRIAETRHDGACVIGFKGYAYDLLLTLCLTLAFVWPLTRGDIISARLRRIASRTLVASIVALITSTVNITVLVSMHGKELGWVCLASCGADATINAMVIAWVSGGREQRFQRCQHNCSGSIPAHAKLGPPSPLPKAGSEWRGRNDVNWDLGLNGPAKLSGEGEWSPSAKFEFDSGRRRNAAGLLVPGREYSVLGPLQEPKTPPLAVPRSGLPFSLPKVTEHSASNNIAAEITPTAPGHAAIHVPIPGPRFSRQNPFARSASHLSDTAPPSSRTISLPEQPDSTPGAGPSPSARRHGSTIDSTDKEDYCDPSPCSRPGSLQPWAEEIHRSVKGVDDRPGSSGDETERGCSAPSEKPPPMSNDSKRPSSVVRSPTTVPD
ncbi:hypothetical protein FRC01_002839 [Tulasnella sp. 417]|nr:hypothetical protein FRC01_002839 [Tulasnella sp. 417]